MNHFISTKNIKKETAEMILSRAREMEAECSGDKIQPRLKGKIIACVFFEPSTRTRLSFETAALKLGADVISAENAAENSSSHKGETIEDTTRMLCGYADAIVYRHPVQGTSLSASKVSTKPIINAGDGPGEHPSQGLLDLYTIKKELKRTNDLTVVFAGDLLYSRTLKSLVPLLMLYPDNKFIFASPKELELPREFIAELKKNGVVFTEQNDLKSAIEKADVLYMTRVQKERFVKIEDYNKVKDLFILKKEDISELKQDAIIMHPLPRINEIDPAIDADPRAAYFREAQNGLYVRMALLLYALGL